MDGPMTRVDPSTLLADNPVIAVLRAGHAREYPPVIAALVAGGVRLIELTLSTDAVFDELGALRDEFGAEASIGIGTVTTRGQARASLDGGADFIVTPTTEPEVVEVAVEAGVPVFPGGLTPTELYRSWSAGASAVKLFPASSVGPGYIGQLLGPFPDIKVIPSGGVGIDDAVEWIDAGAVAVSLGGPLVGDAFSGGDIAALTGRARRLTTIVGEAVDRRGRR
jgi:2-dehydro-3-deoxyphosphogluconate aldolase/(4S)-4-hydroxy-2-oxoglutarate aldolase